MENYNGLRQKVINLDEKEFEAVALGIFRFQVASNHVYREFIEHLEIDPDSISNTNQIPFLPIELFKSRKVVSGEWESDVVFTSSGTGDVGVSKHFVQSLNFYEQVSLKIFSSFYDTPNQYQILALLPSYLERSGSSLVYMLHNLIDKSQSPYSGFFLKDYKLLADQLQKLNDATDRKTMLWGVSFALLDFAEKHQMDLSNCIIVETGGMKGRRQELIRSDLHGRLKHDLGCKNVHSEYGMAELTSQAYALDGRFRPPPWMKVQIRDISDPFTMLPAGRVGGVNIIDLANVHSCSFIQTQDLGELDNHGSFSILGRLDNSDVRGCNLMFTMPGEPS